MAGMSPSPAPLPPAAPATWSPDDLAGDFTRLSASPAHVHDLIVVGAGITGAGVARDAAMRGLGTVLIEANDLAFGTSSRSSRLIHGGVRYLEQGEIGLVFEALRERSRLFQLAPRLVAPAQFLFPSFREDRLQPWKLSLGLTLYDALALYRGGRHRKLSPQAARTVEPTLRSEGLRGAVQYLDAVTDDARLTLANVQGARAAGAAVLTYSPVKSLERASDHHRVTTANGLVLRARAVVLATGPWTGASLFGAPGERLLQLSKGVHLVVPASDAPVRQPVVIQVPNQRRILFAVPWGPRTYLGTTDTSFEGDPGESGVTEADERDVLEIVGRALGGATLRRDRIISAWSGVRPLVAAGGDTAAGQTVELARTHRLIENEDGVLALVGGKLTTFRAMAEEAVDRVVAQLRTAPTSRPQGDATIAPCTSHRVPLLSPYRAPANATAHPVIRELARRRAGEASTLTDAIHRSPALAAPLCEGLPYRWAEVEHAIHYEGVFHLDDILRRRIPLALTDTRLGGGVMHEVARRLVDARGGAQRDIDAEIARYTELVHKETRRVPH